MIIKKLKSESLTTYFRYIHSENILNNGNIEVEAQFQRDFDEYLLAR